MRWLQTLWPDPLWSHPLHLFPECFSLTTWMVRIWKLEGQDSEYFWFFSGLVWWLVLMATCHKLVTWIGSLTYRIVPNHLNSCGKIHPQMWMVPPEAAQMKHGRSNVIQGLIAWPSLVTESAYPIAVTTVDIRTCVSRFQSLTKEQGFPRKL